MRDNLAFGRDMVVTAGSVPPIAAAYEGVLRTSLDARLPVGSLRQRVSGLPPGTLYVLTVLAPYDDMPLDRADLAATVRWLTGDTVNDLDLRSYNVMCGRTGERPALITSEDRPFRIKESMGHLRLDIRMESWLPADTIRRMGFGHVIVNRRHAHTIDRGISFVALDADGAVLQREYAAALFAPEPRYLVRPVDR